MFQTPMRNFRRSQKLFRNHFKGVCKKDMVANQCYGWWPSSHQGATCPKMHCWRCLKHGHRPSQCELSNSQRKSTFHKIRTAKQLNRGRDCFLPFWMERTKECYSVDNDTADLAIRGVHWCAIQVAILPKQITAFISLSSPMCLEMQFWVTHKGERVKGWKRSQNKKLQLVLLNALWGFDVVNTPSALTHTTRQWAEAH